MEHEVNKELDGLKRDMVVREASLIQQRQKWADLLKGELGKDMKDVLDGKVKVKLTFKEKMMFNIRYYKNKIRKLFGKDEVY